MWLSQTFDLKYPVMQGGMAHVATPEFAAAVCEAGAMGIVGTGAMTVEMVADAIRTVRERTDKPFGVNLMMLNPQIEQIAELVRAEKVPLITTGAGNPERYVKAWQQSGAKVIPVVASLAMGQRMQKIGVDAVVAEGQEAGGHVGEMTSMVLWPLLSRDLDIPVIGAGGIATGEQIVAAKALGVSGFQLGTIMLSALECPIHDHYRDFLLKARDSQITVLGRIGGIPCRVLKNPMCRYYLERERAGAEKMELEHIMVGALRKAVHEGDRKEGAFMMGQAASLINRIKPLPQLFKELFDEADEVLAKLK